MAFFARGLHARSHKTSRVVLALILREMSTTYGRSPGGYIWAILEPIAGITLLSLVFASAFRTPPLGNNFMLFYASGFLPFLLYVAIAQRVGTSIRFSKKLLSYPSVTYFDALVARFLLATLTQVMVFLIILTGIIYFGDIRPFFDAHQVLNSLGMAAALGLGVGTLNCFLFGTFPIWEQLWSIVNRPLFFVSCIFFLFESVPAPFSNFLVFNPLIHVVGAMRRGLYTNYQGAYIESQFIYLFSISAFAIGLLLLNRYNRTILSNR